MTPLVLNEYRDLFRDGSSFEHFVTILTKSFAHDLSPVIYNEDVLGTVLSPGATKEVLYERMIRRLSHSPETLDEIRDRLENDEIVD